MLAFRDSFLLVAMVACLALIPVLFVQGGREPAGARRGHERGPAAEAAAPAE
ncbi:hypothetical protein D3C83_270120 [compost metagenome]